MSTSPYTTMARALGLCLLVAVAQKSHAADHFDGDETGQDAASDIADFFAFPVDDGKRLALVMDTHPRAGVDNRFSDAVEYGFRIRPAALERTARGVVNRVSDREFRVSCAFDVVDDETKDQRVSCSLLDGTTEVAWTAVDVDDESGGEHAGFRVFAGLRADPFFTDAIRVRLPRPRFKSLPGFIGTGNSMRPAKTAVGVNLGGPKSTRRQVPNVLGIVVEIDVASLLDNSGPQFAVVAETRRRAFDASEDTP